MEYAIGDIHGCIRSLRLLLDQIQPGATDTVILLVDYLDRGPDSCAVPCFLASITPSGTRSTMSR
jgi:serine/threonine protein phosphatase 1